MSSTRARIMATAASAGVLAIGWNVGTQSGATMTTVPATGATRTAPTTAAATQAAAPATTRAVAPATTAATSTGLKDGTFTGTATQYNYGSIAVTVTVSGGKITNVTQNAQTAGDQRSQLIQSQALPMLDSEVMAAQSTQINAIGGATFTSEAYYSSLQAALDQAKA